MAIRGLTGKILTVLGTIDPKNLGITLPHEHFLADFSVRFVEPAEASGKLLARLPVTEVPRGWLYYHPTSNMDNIATLDVDIAIEEGLRFKQFGGSSVIDVTNVGIGRDPVATARIARSTGLNIILGSGYYVEETCPELKRLSEEQITEEIVRDITVGIGISGIRAGIIGEIGTEWPIRETEKKSLRASAKAQKKTGAGLIIHTGNSPSCALQIVEILDKAGADISRVVISHTDSRIFDPKVEVQLAKAGCYLAYDTFSFEGWYARRMVLSEANPVKCDVPNDAQRINRIMHLIDKGFLDRVLVSHDQSFKYRMWHYGGPGIAHILENVAPLMKEKGLTEEQVNTILIENPKRLLTFA